MKVIYLYIIILACIVSCKINDKEVQNSITPCLPNSESIVKGEEITISTMINPSRIKISKNFLYISCFKCDTMIYTFSLPDLKLLGHFGNKGNGPEDYLFPIFTNTDNDTISIWGNSNLKKIKQFKVNKSGKWRFIKEYYLKENKAYNQLFTTDSFAFYSEYPPMLILKRINLQNMNEDRYHEFKMNRSISESFFEPNRGDLCGYKNKLAYLYYYKNRIDFLDSNLNISKSYTQTNKTNINTNNHNESFIYYKSYFAGIEHLYAINHNDKLKNRKKTCKLEIFTWNGILSKKIYLNPSIDIFAVDETDNILYGYNYDTPDIFYKYNLHIQ